MGERFPLAHRPDNHKKITNLKPPRLRQPAEATPPLPLGNRQGGEIRAQHLVLKSWKISLLRISPPLTEYILETDIE